MGAWTRSDPNVYQSELDNGPTVAVSEVPNGLGRIETYTVLHNQQGPTQAICIGILEEGSDKDKRFIAISKDADTLAKMVSQDYIGRKVSVRSEAGGKGRNTF